ncbi:hypothetical protein GCM10011363_44850 [Marivita lacus]|uniref:Gas vesicle protein GvpFL n=1 Tax=Marivita lacus TaxID=1323742 RepID=A0ABQ1LH79_9RHOB|nr:GvpL/GvpF family gas vesicle protein [Marivita lacus]GGC23411.1 hypothetical protein GCM10011363_44850 [Marivita lacus]
MTDTIYAVALISRKMSGLLPDELNKAGCEIVSTQVGDILIRRIGPETVALLKAAHNAAGLRAVTDWILFHERVNVIASNHGSVYPFSFATLFSSDEVLRQAVIENSEALQIYFSHVKEADEWAIKICAPKTQDFRIDDAQNANSGLDYLQRRRARNAGDRVATMASRAEALVSPLKSFARDWKTLRTGLAPQTDLDVVGTFAALVGRNQADEFTSQLRIQAETVSGGLQVSCTGPWLPFSFRPSFRAEVMSGTNKTSPVECEASKNC